VFALHGLMPSSLKGTVATTRHLLDGAIAAAERRSPVTELPPLTKTGWALQLVDQWYVAHHSVALLPLAVSRYEAICRPDLARFAQAKLLEEAGHDLLPLNDLRALGYEPRAVVERVPPGSMARALVEYARESIAGRHPVRFVGYVYALERRVIRITEPMLGALETALGARAASGVRAHAADFDRGHVEKLLKFVAGLPARDRTEIVLGCHATAAICCTTVDPAQTAEREQRLTHLTNPISASTSTLRASTEEGVNR
jgi:hypothetical protein